MEKGSILDRTKKVGSAFLATGLISLLSGCATTPQPRIIYREPPPQIIIYQQPSQIYYRQQPRHFYQRPPRPIEPFRAHPPMNREPFLHYPPRGFYHQPGIRR